LCEQFRSSVRRNHLTVPYEREGEKRYPGKDNPFRLAYHSVASLGLPLLTDISFTTFPRFDLRHSQATPLFDRRIDGA
jgi:hypothetical protein